MKNTQFPLSILYLIIIVLISLNSSAVNAQFQTSIGAPFPVNETGVGGFETSSGNFLILGDHSNNPNGISNSLGDIELIQLNALGYLINPSKMLGTDSVETADWIEKTICGNGGYIIAGTRLGNLKYDMTVSLLDLNCNPIWTKFIGDANANENSVCIKEDGNGDFILVGTKEYFVQAVKLDCSGNVIWNKIYTFPVSGIAASVTAFATFSSACANLPNEYYITGTSVSPNGNNEMFILSVNVVNGNLVWLNTYDIAPNAADYATCIQGSCQFSTALKGELWVSGYSIDLSTSKSQIFMMKTAINGNPIWANNYEIVGEFELATHFQFATTGDLLITGRAEGLISPPRPATKTGQCFLMKVRNDGNQVYWNRIYEQGFASQGNRVEGHLGLGYFITGYSYQSDPPNGFEFNILAIKTDSLGQTSSNCFHNPITDIIKRTADSSRVIPKVTAATNLFSNVFFTKPFQDTQRFCIVTPKLKCDSLFTFLDRLHTLPSFCCFNLFVDNPTPNCFTKIQITLSSGTFNNVNANAGWTVNGGPTQIEFVHSSNFVPQGSNNPTSFCLGGVTNPFTLTVSYIYSANGVAGKCEERYLMNCPALPFEACDCPNGSIPGPNLVINGDFLNGNSGFTTGYPYIAPPTAFGFAQYSVRNSTNLINPAWACLDHTSGLPLGEFLAVDGSTLTFVPCWQENVFVTLGKEYSFCAFVNNMVNTLNNFDNPIVQLWINNTFQATVTLPEIPDTWVKLSAHWTSNVTGFIPIEIRPGTPTTSSGCDFAVDDIAFHECLPNLTCDSNACKKNLVKNPGFFQGAVVGTFLGVNAFSNNWVTATQSPQVVNDSCCDPIAILMWGNKDKGESICQNLNFQSGHTYNVHFCARFFNQPTLSTNYIRFGFSATNACNSTYNCISPNCEKIGESSSITNQSWNTYSLSNWTAASNWTNLIIRAFNNNKDIQGIDTTVSWGMIDDICIEDLTTATENLSANKFSVFPNPTNSNLIIELADPATLIYTITAIDLFGKKVINEIIAKGEKHKILDMSKVANGFYLMELKDKNFKTWYQKVVKE